MFFNVLLLVLILTLAFWIYKIQVQSRDSRYLRRIFDSPPGIPILGNALLFAFLTPTDAYFKFLQIAKHFSCKPLIVWLFYKPYFVLTHHTDFQLITHMLEKDPLTSRFIAEGIGNGIITSEVAHWKRSRCLMNPAFNTTTIINYYLPVFNEQNIKLIEKLKKEIGMGKTFDVGPHILGTTFASTYENIMGIDENMDDELLHLLHTTTTKYVLTNKNKLLVWLISKRVISPWLHPLLAFKLYLYAKGCPKIFEEYHDFYKKKITKKMSMFNDGENSKNTNAQQRKALVDMLLETHSFTSQQLIDEVMTLLFAGSDTPAAAISFTLLMLAQHQGVQEKVYQELFEIFGDDLRFPQAEDLSKMVFLEQCIKETLRKYCIVPLIVQQATEDVKLNDGRIIPNGSSVAFLLHPLHHNPEVYPDPDTWNPHNFHPESVAKRPPNTFMPFMSGARMCIGYKYTMIYMKSFLSTFIRHFKISTSQKEIRLDVAFVIRSKDGYHLELTERQTNAVRIQE